MTKSSSTSSFDSRVPDDNPQEVVNNFIFLDGKLYLAYFPVVLKESLNDLEGSLIGLTSVPQSFSKLKNFDAGALPEGSELYCYAPWESEQEGYPLGIIAHEYPALYMWVGKWMQDIMIEQLKSGRDIQSGSMASMSNLSDSSD